MSAAPEQQQELLKSDSRLSPFATQLSLMQAEQQQANQQAMADRQAKIEDAVLQRNAMLPVYAKEQEIRGQKNPSGTKVNVGFGTEAENKMMDSKSVIDEALSFAEDLKNVDPSYLDIRGAMNFTALDEHGFGQRAMNLVDLLGKSRSGASLNKQEEVLYGKLIKGDATADPADMRRLLTKLAQAEARRTKSKIDFSSKLRTGGAISELDNVINLPEANIQETPAVAKRIPGETIQDYLARTGK